MTNVEALKRLYQQVGGDPSTLDANTNLELLNAISETLGGEVGAEQNAVGIDNVAAVASGGGGSFKTQTVTLNINEHFLGQDSHSGVLHGHKWETRLQYS